MADKETLKVISYLWSHITTRGEYPSSEIIEIFKRKKWIYSGRVYRGIHWHAEDKYKFPFTSPYGNFKIGDKINETKKNSSWTTDKSIALSFAAYGDYDNYILAKGISWGERINRAHERKEASSYAGIIIEATIKNGLWIQRAYDELKKEKELSKYFKKFKKVITEEQIPESEVIMVTPVTGKIIEHFHSILSAKIRGYTLFGEAGKLFRQYWENIGKK